MTKILIFILFSSISYSQIGNIDVTFYDLSLLFNLEKKYIIGSNKIHFTAKEKLDYLEIDLHDNFTVDSVLILNKKIKFSHSNKKINISFEDYIYPGNHLIEVFYNGKPKPAKNPPWDGGFVFNKDKYGSHWVGVACQGLGSSSWWPSHDVLFDEPDSVRLTSIVPKKLNVVSNGNLIHTQDTIIDELEKKIFVWQNSFPINNYNVSVNIADFVHFSDTLTGLDGELNLDYYVLRENYRSALTHFKQVKPMLHIFEKKFGPYPFYNDGYKLVETSYLGMEHQTCISYGNKYKKGYLGQYPSNIDFDFIIIHETAHEWWGNSVSMGCQSDMWIHESFATYAEALYVEEMYGYGEMIKYLNYQKTKIKNLTPIKSESFSSTDMYYKGSWMLHSLRSIFADDVLWFKVIKNLQNKFKYQIVDTYDIINHIQNYIEYDLTYFFNQYLFNSLIPTFQYYISKEKNNFYLNYKWNAIENFDMPILISQSKEDLTWIYPKNNWKKKQLMIDKKSDFVVLKDLFLVNIKKSK